MAFSVFKHYKLHSGGNLSLNTSKLEKVTWN